MICRLMQVAVIAIGELGHLAVQFAAKMGAEGFVSFIDVYTIIAT